MGPRQPEAVLPPEENDLRKKTESIRLCLYQLEEETRSYGLEFPAMMIRAAALSLLRVVEQEEGL